MINDEVEWLPFSQTKGLTEEDNLIPLGSVLFSRGLPLFLLLGYPCQGGTLDKPCSFIFVIYRKTRLMI